MHNLRRFYYKNKYKIWAVILFIVLILAGIQVMNKIAAWTNQQKMNEIDKNNGNLILNDKEKDTYITSDKSAVTGEKIENTTLEKATKTIEDFALACNQGDIEQAYNLLSDDCKNELYTDINKFKTLYYDTIFTGSKKTVSVENWLLNTYKVNIMDDIMATGNANGMKAQDYITIVKEGENLKLNINSFVKKEKLNKSQNFKNLEIIVISKNVYMDYEEYEIQIKNNTDGMILLDSKKNTKTIYIQDDKETKYFSYSHEILENLLKINKGFSSKLEIKFVKSYSKERTTKSIIFSDVIFNYSNNINDELEKSLIKINI